MSPFDGFANAEILFVEVGGLFNLSLYGNCLHSVILFGVVLVGTVKFLGGDFCSVDSSSIVTDFGGDVTGVSVIIGVSAAD